MKHISAFMMWAGGHAVLRESGGSLFVDKTIIGTDPWNYLHGTTGVRCTQYLLDKKYADKYKGWGWSPAVYNRITAGWAGQVIVCDCQGLEDCYSGADTNAKGNYAKYCSDQYKGHIKNINRPYVFGEELFCGATPETIDHVAWVIGLMPNGEPIILHERGLAHGCVIERISQSGKDFTFRALADKRYVYTILASGSDVEEMPVDLPDTRVLTLQSPMMRGDDVRELQTVLTKLGFGCGVIDGVYGGKTDAALKNFQTRARSMIEGVCDEVMRQLLGM